MFCQQIVARLSRGDIRDSAGGHLHIDATFLEGEFTLTCQRGGDLAGEGASQSAGKNILYQGHLQLNQEFHPCSTFRAKP